MIRKERIGSTSGHKITTWKVGFFRVPNYLLVIQSRCYFLKLRPIIGLLYFVSILFFFFVYLREIFPPGGLICSLYSQRHLLGAWVIGGMTPSITCNQTFDKEVSRACMHGMVAHKSKHCQSVWAWKNKPCYVPYQLLGTYFSMNMGGLNWNWTTSPALGSVPQKNVSPM